ncbi:MAG: AEC family transporter [Silicimonas sp.]|nr:AEC family transporter [Silicimonas sp.]
MLHVLTHNILPVFSMLALGFLLGRARTASLEEARAVNRIAFLVLQPPLIFMLLTGMDLAGVRWDAVGLYALCEVVAFLATFALARAVFRCGVAEAFLLGMAVTFVNSLLYLWPIATLIYGEAGAIPISAIVALDASVSFVFFIVGMEVIAGKGLRAATLRRIGANPVILTIVASLVLNVLRLPIPEPVLTAARFAGAGAAPMTLFAMGVVLSHHAIRPNATIAGVSAMKLILFPALVWAVFAAFSPENPWRDLFLLNAAGPSGAMAFSLALLYGVRPGNIAPVIVWTSTLSLISLAWLA